MDDPLVPKRLQDAISIVGTCLDMCPRFERYRRERENNLFEWETIPGTKRIDHNHAVKMYERAAGDKTIPSDLRPPHVLKRTLDYLFHNLMPRGGFSQTFNFIRDRSRAVRNDFTMQHITGHLAIECHDRCARFHILALHMERNRSGFSIPLEEQQLMNTLQSLKEFYEDQRGRYQSPTELEMRVYHRLIHIRDQKERHEDIPDLIRSHPVFKLTTDFRMHVQKKSAPISKTSRLIVDAEAMEIFGQLANYLREMGNVVVIYLVACILERLFGEETIDDIDSIRGDLTLSQIIDGVISRPLEGDEGRFEEVNEEEEGHDEIDDFIGDDVEEGVEVESSQDHSYQPLVAPTPLKPGATQWLSSNLPSAPPSNPSPSATTINTPPVASSAFANIVSTPNAFGTPSVFGASVFPSASTGPTPVFGNPAQNIFGGPSFPATSAPPSVPVASVFGPPTNIFGLKSNGPSPSPLLSTGSLDSRPASAILTAADQSQTSANGVPSGSSTVNGLPRSPPQPKPHFPSSQPPSSTPTPSHSLNPTAPPFTPPSLAPPSFKVPGWNDFTSTTPATASPIPQPSRAGSQHLQLSGDSRTTFTFTPPLTKGPSNPFTVPPSTPTTGPTPSPVPPPTNGTRLIAPPLLKIDTNTSTGSSAGSLASASPRVPPPLPKRQPIPLPMTPNIQPQNPLLGHLRQNLDTRTPGSPSAADVLSPLFIATTSTGKMLQNFSPIGTPVSKKLRRSDSEPSLLSLSPPLNGKGKERESTIYDIPALDRLEQKAVTFERQSVLVRGCFDTWVKRTTDRAAWLEACRKSDVYRKKLQQSQSQPELLRNGTPLEKKRRLPINEASSTTGLSPSKKRPRKRMSAEYRPLLTDEELARRFKENHEEHELRWAQGSFLQVIRNHVKRLNPSTLNLPWHIWLSMNPESDATAIWIERKFDVPDSGSWVSDSVFSIPLSSATVGPTPPSNYPGLIVFECTPLGDTADDLEKKYRILDDCARLRETIKALPAKRHFVPSLLIFCWTGEEQAGPESDFFDMVKKLVGDSVLQSYHIFSMTTATKDLDNKLGAALDKLQLDTEGSLVQMLSVQSAFKTFEPSFDSFVGEWIGNCSTFGRFNWRLYGQVVQASVILLNLMSESVRTLLELQSQGDPLPPFDGSQFDDRESAYDDTNEWLGNLNSHDDAVLIVTDLQSHRNINQEFPARIFLEHLYDLNQTRLERSASHQSDNQYPVLITHMNSTLESFKQSMQPYQMTLLQTYNFSVRRSPKRRSYSITSSEQGSPEAKRQRLSDSVASSSAASASAPGSVSSTPELNGYRSPSPTHTNMSLTSTEAPTVTVAMLRALTKDLKKKYMPPS